MPVLARELRAGGSAAAVREGGPADDAAVLVWVGEADEDALRAASRARVPIVAVTEAESVPYVLETDLVRLRPGEGFPLAEIATAIARRSRVAGPALAAQLPVLRDAVVADLIQRSSRRNAIIAAAVFVPGADMPVLTLTQVRLVARIALAHGKELDRARGLELLGVVGAGFGFRGARPHRARPRPGRGLRGQGRGRVRRHARGRRGRAPLLRRARLTRRSVRRGSYSHPGWAGRATGKRRASCS